MSNTWVRLYHDAPNDPKFRTISRASGQPISLVLALWMHLLVNASQNETERGVTQCDAENLATALDVSEEQIRAVFDAMQGRVLEGLIFTAWEKRQPKREDSSTKRMQEYRMRHNSNVTQCDAREDKIREDLKKEKQAKEKKTEDRELESKFDAFWKAYPRKDAKLAARRAFWTACKRETPDNIIRAAEAYAESVAGTDAKYVKMPTTWLNGGCFLNEKPPDVQPVVLKTPQEIVEKLKAASPKMTDAVISRWIDPCVIDGSVITAPSKFHAEWLENNYRQALETVFGLGFVIIWKMEKAA